jgi:hypothetical protein
MRVICIGDLHGNIDELTGKASENIRVQPLQRGAEGSLVRNVGGLCATRDDALTQSS